MKAILSLLVVLAPATAVADKSFNSGGGATWDCAKDSEVSVNTSNGVYTFKGACTDISLNGSNLTVAIESIEDLNVNGGRNTVTVGAIDDLSVNGTNNTVTYARGLKGKPDINVMGTGNSVKVSGAATATVTTTTTPTTPTTPTAPTTTTTGSAKVAVAVANATILDCGQKASVAITKSKTNYKLVGSCEKVAISASSTSISIEAVKNLAITGSKNAISVDKADKIATMGAGNTVMYGGGLSVPAPKIATMGKSNTVVQGTASTTASTTTTTVTTTPTTTATAGAIDCTKTATHTVDQNGGSFTFVGTCELINVTGNDNNLTVASAKAIYVAGNDNRITALAVDRLSVPGNENKVTWKTGVTAAKAKLSVPGNRNSVAQAK